MRESDIAQYAGPVPRYTSYPTAPHFHAGVDAKTYAGWLRDIAEDAQISLYVHIPFCDRLCWFCGCTTKQTLHYEPIRAYLKVLEREITHVAGLTGGRGTVTALHLGGGSPSMLTPEDMVGLDTHLRSMFVFAADAEISIEIDPNDMTGDRYDALREVGLTRASLGVQDFDDRVQQAINREQTFAQTRAVVDAVRARGIDAINLDVLYGLPHQSVDSVRRTIEQAISLAPARVALFGYAHVPWMKKHQRLIDESALPDAIERLAQQGAAARLLAAAGYRAIGIDHFALPGDPLAVAAWEGTLRRNFQGYTTDRAEVLIGLGASAISQLPQGYAQSTPGSGEYAHRIAEDGLATVRGFALADTDRVRAAAIEQLMCEFRLDAGRLKARFGAGAEAVLAEAAQLAAREPNGFFQPDTEGYLVTPAGRPFVRSFAAHFDAYLGAGTARHSIAV